MDPVVMVAFEVGKEKKKLVGKYADGKLSVELTEPAKFGKLSDLLKDYGVSVEKWPRFLQEAAAVEGWLWALDYRTVSIGTTSDTTISAASFNPAPNADILKALTDAVIEKASSADGKETYTIKKKGEDLAYSVAKNDDKYTVEAKVYKLLIQAYYADSLTLVKGLLHLKSLAFGVTNDTTAAAAEFEKECRAVLDKVPDAPALPENT